MSNVRERIHVGPYVDEAVAAAVRDAGGRLVKDPSEASASIVLSSDRTYIDRILATDVLWIQFPWAGIEHCDFSRASKEGRIYTSAGPAYARDVAEHALGMCLALYKGIHRAARAKVWNGDMNPRRLAGATVLLVGTGHIGTAMADLLGPFGVHVYGMNRSGTPLGGAVATLRAGDVSAIPAETELAIVSLPHTPDTTGLVGLEFLSRLRPGSFLVNVGRGAVVDTGALMDSIDGGRLSGAALDVTDPEPLPETHRLWEMEEVLVTPHIANPPVVVGPGLPQLVEENVGRWISGSSLSGVVDPGRGY